MLLFSLSWWSSSASMLALLLLLSEVSCLGEVMFAVNCGGDPHVDSLGIHYMADTLSVGTASDYGKQLMIGRVSPLDQLLYQTERYHTSTFGYDVPVPHDGHYVLVLKFSEVYFDAPNMKVFDVVLNGDLTLAADLDIYERVGRGVAHDELVELEVRDNHVWLHGEQSQLTRGKMRVEFIKSYRDNPKVNAIVLMSGRLSDWPPLPPLEAPPHGTDYDDDDEQDDKEDDEDDENVVDESVSKRRSSSRKASGPRAKDPYESDDSSAMLPIVVAVGAFIPLVFCLCKL